MKDYFVWHGKELQRMKEDAKISKMNSNGSDGNYHYLSKYRFLVLQCASHRMTNGKMKEDVCGGLSDRLKSFPFWILLAAASNRILFIRWSRPAAIENFMVPGNLWNWTVPDDLSNKIEKLDESIDTEKFSRLYVQGYWNKMLPKFGDRAVWMIQGYDYSGGRNRYKELVEKVMRFESASNSNSKAKRPEFLANKSLGSNLKPSDALYSNFYHHLFHATFRPALGVQKLLSKYFYDPESGTNTIVDDNQSTKSWLPVPLKRDRYVVVQYRAIYPNEPYRNTKNETILRETTMHAVECAKSRVRGLRVNQQQRQKQSSTINPAQDVSAVYVASDTGLVIQAAHDAYHNRNEKKKSKKSADPDVWTYLDLLSYDRNSKNSERDGSNNNSITLETKHTTPWALKKTPHLNFFETDEISDFNIIFVDLFLMSYSSCVVFGAGGFGMMGSLASYRPSCGMAFSVDRGTLQHCNPYDDST
mmetsp:Transcript_34365/g.39535  ORF Transcript_34365/g.39535 Transcript_34365/m.39535 type:complete len:474 (+) Transcript_34365:199-1620(+)